jgi:hypothetical protein
VPLVLQRERLPGQQEVQQEAQQEGPPEGPRAEERVVQQQAEEVQLC